MGSTTGRLDRQTHVMANVLITAAREIPLPPDQVFDLFGIQAGAGWLFDAQCDVVRPGSPVTLTVPADVSGETMQILGRIARCVPGRLIEIVHDNPWSGSLRVTLKAAAAATTRVSISASLDQRGLEWVAGRRGWPSRQPDDPSRHRIGLITSKIGPAAVYTVACEYAAQLAIEEINAEGGFHRQLAELVVGDDATDAGRAALEATRLVAAGCRVIIANVNSASFAAVCEAIGEDGLPIIHPCLNEGGGGSEHVLRWGERPIHQVRAVARAAMRDAAGRRWYMIGNDYRWAHGAHLAGSRAIEEADGEIVGNTYVPLGTTDFTRVLEHIDRSGADCILSSLIGADEVAFERQAWAGGLRSRCQTLSLVMEESTRERIGDTRATGIWAAFGYFEDLDTPENHELVSRYRAQVGRWAPPLSSLSVAVYEACMLYASAVRQSASDDPVTVVRGLRTAKARMPRGLVTADGPHALRQNLYVARAVPGGFQLVAN